MEKADIRQDKKLFNSPVWCWISEHFELFIYLLYLFSALMVLYVGRSNGVFVAPYEGTDQLTILEAAAMLTEGKLYGASYLYSYSYTIFLAVLHFLSGGSLVVMRAMQGAVCALIPVFIYRTTLELFAVSRAGESMAKVAARVGALLYLFYAPCLLISLDFLRAAPLGLAFLLFVYNLLQAWNKAHVKYYILAGVWGALALLGRENFGANLLLIALLFIFPKIRNRVGWKNGAIYAVTLLVIALVVVIFNGLMFNSYQLIPGHISNILECYHGAKALDDKVFATISMLKQVPIQAWAFLSSFELENSLSVYAHRDIITMLKSFFIPFNLLVILAFVGSWGYLKNRGVVMIFLSICFYAGSLSFFTMFYRFRVPAVPLVAVLAGVGCVWLFEQARSRSYQKLGIVMVIMALFLWATAVDPNSRRREAERATVVRNLIDNGRYSEATDYFEDMRSYGCDISLGVKLLINSQLKSGLNSDAKATFERFKYLFQKEES